MHMSSPVSDDVACFDSLPDDLVGVIMGKLDLPNTIRLTQACPTARRLVQGERAVPGVLGHVIVDSPCDFNKPGLEVRVTDIGFEFHEFETDTDDEAEAATDEEDSASEEDHAERQPTAGFVHLLEWICVRARAFTEIQIAFENYVHRSILNHIASTFLPNVPSSFRGKISFHFTVNEVELVHLPPFLSAWRALSPAYECGLSVDSYNLPSDVFREICQAAPPLSSFSFEKLPVDMTVFLPTTLRDLSLGIEPECWSGLDAFLAPLHRLTALKLEISMVVGEGRLDSSLTLAPFTALPNLRLLNISASYSSFFIPPPLGSDYWQSSVVLPALEGLSLQYYDHKAKGEGGGPTAVQPSRWPTLLSNLEAPMLERLYYGSWPGIRLGRDRTLDLPLGRFPRLRFFKISLRASVDLPALRAEVATLRHLQVPARKGEAPGSSAILFDAKDPVTEEEAKAWKLDLGFRVRKYNAYNEFGNYMTVSIMCSLEARRQGWGEADRQFLKDGTDNSDSGDSWYLDDRFS